MWGIQKPESALFAKIAYGCVQEHDARLDRLVDAPDWLVMYHVLNDDEKSWLRVMAIRVSTPAKNGANMAGLGRSH